MECYPLRLGSDAAGQYFGASGGHLPRHHKMKQILSRSALWHTSCRGPIYVWPGRTFCSQAVGIQEMEANENDGNKYRRWQEDETKILIAAKNQYDLGKLENRETAGIQLKKIKTSWKEIETICKHRGIQRSAEQCRTRWSRIMLTYLQIKFWEQERTPEVLSYWSMKVDERKATGVLLFNLDRSIYNLLDALYNGSADAVKEEFIKDAVEGTEFGRVENMLLGQGMQSLLKEDSEVGGVANAHYLSASGDDSRECHRLSSQFSSTEVDAPNRKQVECVAGATASVDVSDRENSCSSSLGLAVSHKMQSGKLAGAAAPVENVLQDHRHNSQLARITDPVTQTHEVLRASVASAEAHVSDGQPSDLVSGTAAYVPIMGECGNVDTNGNASVFSLFSEGTHEKQRGLVAETAASLQETHQLKNTQTHHIYVEVSASAEKTCEGYRVSSHPAPTAVEVCNEVQNEQVSGEEFLKSMHVADNMAGGVQEKSPEDVHSSSSLKIQGIDTLLEHDTGQSSEPVLGGHLRWEKDAGSPNEETAFTRAEVFSTMQIEQNTGSEASNSFSVAINTTGIPEERRSEDSYSLPSRCQGMASVLEGDTMHSSRADLAEQIQSSNGDESLNQETNYTGSEVFKIMESEQVACSEESKNNPVAVNTISGDQERMVEGSHSLSYHECQAVDMPLEENSGNDVGSLNQEPEYHGATVQDRNTSIGAEQCGLSQPVHGTNDRLGSITDDGCIDMVIKITTTTEGKTSDIGFGESCEAKIAETLERPATESPETDGKGSVKEKGLQLYDGRKYDDDVLMYVPAAIGNVVRSVSQAFKKFFKA